MNLIITLILAQIIYVLIYIGIASVIKKEDPDKTIRISKQNLLNVSKTINAK